MSPTQSEKIFYLGLKEKADHINLENGLKPNDDIQINATLVLTHIVSKSITEAGHILVDGFFENNQAEATVAFICFVSMYITLFLEREGIDVEGKTLIADSSYAVLQLIPEKKKENLIVKGNQIFRSLVSSAHPDVKKYVDIISYQLYEAISEKRYEILDEFKLYYQFLLELLIK